MTSPEPKIVTASFAPITMENLERGTDDLTWNTRLFREMIDQQYKVNNLVAAKTGVNWLEKAFTVNWDFLFAGIVELTELANSREDWWKWWTFSSADHMNVKIELVDAFHFFLSYDIASEIPYNLKNEVVIEKALSRLASDYADQVIRIKGRGKSVARPEGKTAVGLIKRIFRNACDVELADFDSFAFFDLCDLCNLDIATFHKIYIGKACLNQFRQKHGYKEGTYHKTWWNGKEDNFYLVDWLSNDIEDNLTGKELEEAVMNWLESSYASFNGISER